MKFMIQPGAPLRSASVPTTKPGVSIRRTSGMLKLSHITWKSMILRQASCESAPPPNWGLLAMMTLLPFRRARPTRPALPKRGLNSKKLSLSTMISTIRRMS